MDGWYEIDAGDRHDWRYQIRQVWTT